MHYVSAFYKYFFYMLINIYDSFGLGFDDIDNGRIGLLGR
jgi:hypothetical protein